MNVNTDLRAVAPTALSTARSIAHNAAQLLTSAARANLDPAPDDSHSNLGWDKAGHRFLSQPLTCDKAEIFVGLSLSPLRLELTTMGGGLASLELDGSSMSDAHKWLDSQLEQHGLQPGSGAELPYDLPADVATVTTFGSARFATELSALAAWFGLAETVLADFAAAHADLHPGPGPVRCWPHHFDIATYVQLEPGDFESARGVGVGMSPGDESYGQPYFYINAWPHLDANDLPELPAPGHWHREGFVGAIATAEEVLSLENIYAQLPSFVEGAFSLGRQKLGI